ncbi:O-methyltransferase [Aspergillus bertholletiae]|uniref:O-methyltransferase n=1 Tax=Aspergillus bertholletiae TaxID=1226010 RepID=A0A5N7BIR7_9EURO|nr:O-methyltransferase [Aspergillus bertholletiae]
MSTNITLKNSKEVDSYAVSHLVAADEALTNTISNCAKNGIPPIAVSPGQGKFLSLLTKMSGAHNVLEIGTLGGYSSIWFARALKANGNNGKVTSIEILEDRRDLAIENLRNAGVKVPEEAEVLLGPGLEVLPRLEEEIQQGKRPKFDFVFIDADWDNQWQYFDYSIKLTKAPGAVILIDNIVQRMLEDGIVGPEKRQEGAISVVEKVGQDKRVEAALVQTVGAKSHDGFLMALVL